MDLNQEKLTKTEWESTEIPISEDEKEIMRLIMTGYHDINHIYNKKKSMLNYLSLQPNINLMEHIYNAYYKEKIDKLKKKYALDFEDLEKIKFSRVNSTEKVKLDNLSNKIKECQDKIFEYILLYLSEGILRYKVKKNWDKFNKFYYTLFHIIQFKITNIIPKVKLFASKVLEYGKEYINISALFEKGSDLIENNVELFDYKDYKLYQHQKQLFQIYKQSEMYLQFKNSDPYFKRLFTNEEYDEEEEMRINQAKQLFERLMKPKLILYTAPTGTGKTLSPIALASEYKIIFVCAARHVGLALAKTAISVGKKVAFAFGCHDASDIRLHYNAAASYFRHEYNHDKEKCSCGRKGCSKDGQPFKYKDGKMKVRNEDGSNVEIMICDIKSYLYAMNYMCAFNKIREEIILYWDEPTITLDYENHEHHKEIQNIWSKNIIPNIVLSSATLPLERDIPETISDYKSKFIGGQVHSIVSHDCEKSIPIVNNENKIELPHLKYKDYNELQSCVRHCRNYMTLLRYFDLKEIIKFISFVDETEDLLPEDRENDLSVEYKYDDLSNLNINSIKEHYLEILENINPEKWNLVYNYFQKIRQKIFESTVYVGTSDAHTLTDGPAIFLTQNVEKISKFILQTSKIPAAQMNYLLEAIEYNDKLLNVISEKSQKLEDVMGDEVEKENKMAKQQLSPEAKKLKGEIDELTKLVKYVELNEVYIPNKPTHLKKWADKEMVTKEFSGNINSEDVEQIMLMNGVDITWKLLLLMGIGVFSSNLHKDYTEIMKNLANNQKLYLIVADSDYIYGTNYQFCHGYLSKDLENMTQEKTIQAMGRMGRNNKHMDFSIRFRDDTLIEKIFQKEENRREVINMNNLFCTELDLSDF
uniref:Uncharacterized protein n=1 Tax=viral metagenome TaxID=1070528 RepID=A0A6C0CKI9_9ZZZZ